jgi:hypothetical protein
MVVKVLLCAGCQCQNEIDEKVVPFRETRPFMNRLPLHALSMASLPKLRYVLGPAIAQGARGDSCGCSMAAKFLVVGLIISIIWYVRYGPAAGPAAGAIFVRILLWSILAACAGKVVGIAHYSWRRRRLRLKTIR